LQRLLLQKLEVVPAFYLFELFPPMPARARQSSNSLPSLSYRDPRIVALRRAARSLGNAGKLRRFYDLRDRYRRLVIARPSMTAETLRLPRMSARRRTELDLRLQDDERSARNAECHPYRLWLAENGLLDDDEAYEGWLDEIHYDWIELDDDDEIDELLDE
jgi:hypothetical protein